MLKEEPKFLIKNPTNTKQWFLGKMWNCTHKKLHPYFKKCNKSFCNHKTYFLLKFLFLVYSLGYILGITPLKQPSWIQVKNKWVQFRVGAIPSEQFFLSVHEHKISWLTFNIFYSKNEKIVWFFLKYILKPSALIFVLFLSFRN